MQDEYFQNSYNRIMRNNEINFRSPATHPSQRLEEIAIDYY